MPFLQTAFLRKRTIPDRDALERAAADLGFDLVLTDFYQPFKSTGYHPCRINGSSSGFQLSFKHAADIAVRNPNLASRIGARDAAMEFRWTGKPGELASVMILCAALVSQFDALVNYNDEKWQSMDDLLGEAADGDRAQVRAARISAKAADDKQPFLAGLWAKLTGR